MATTVETHRAGTAREQVFDAFRRWGYLDAQLDPLGESAPPVHPALEFAGSDADDAARIYCASIGAEFMHIPDPERRDWVQQQMEAQPPAFGDPARILEQLARAELLEQVLQSRYLGTKRFSLEGVCSLIPLLHEVLAGAAEAGAEQVVMGMSHRGRLNVMVNVVGKTAIDVFARFEDVDPRSVLGSGDVKYHVGATGEVSVNGRVLRIHLVSNPSHLEAVDPVALGRTRAKQMRLGARAEQQVLPVLMHGDAAFAGQGIVGETFDFAGVRGYSVGGTIHIVVNNLIGFTATPPELHTSRFASDAARRLAIPIFHVNAEQVESVIRVARMAVEYRGRFRSDVVIDLVGFRRHGHSEVDDPTITQPLRYRKIHNHPPVHEIYARQRHLDPGPVVEQIKAEYHAELQSAAQLTKKPLLATLPPYWAAFQGGCWKPEYDVPTGIPLEQAKRLGERLASYPQGFNIHPKIKRLLQQRAEMAACRRPLDYGMAEALAFASLLVTGVPVRLSGQDSRRGTFNQRHSVLIDTENEAEYVPLEHLEPGQARCEIYNSILSEAAVMGFEYGFSREMPEALVLWEAQFGDFANGAQIIIDQFVSAGEGKWGLLSGLVLLLPHGYEGQGPEHSSARIERYLQLAARDNLQIAQPSNAAQYFHLLRRQALSRWRKPLIVFTPKSMLRHPDAGSPLADLARERFLPVLPDAAGAARRVLLCSGKIGHELREERKRRGDSATAIVLLEQLYPFPEPALAAALEQHPQAHEIVWVQEEPANMGALFYVMPRLRRLATGRQVRSVKRSASSSPATGSAKAHELEQKTLLELAFSTA
ncbi:MAG: 2-oxoglutarate dehydrogenase E1 component [Acidobacteria bacterium]|nr:2-oxoglutarate dehydrogenase E1 component [Acidobacteriota bacterium]